MKLHIGTNFDPKLLDGIKDTSASVIYGKLHTDVIGGGRPAFLLPKVTAEDVEEHVKLAHKYGFEFNYLLNTACMGNLETTSEVNKKIFELIDWLKAIKVDWVTVVFPYFVDVIKKYAPDIKISLSTFACVDTLQKALKYEKMGVHQITLPEWTNRNFSLLKLLKKQLTCDVQVIVTNTCLATCPYRNTHTNFLSHASQGKGYAVNHCMLRCTHETTKDPVELIKSPWVRPEDLHFYEEIGINNFKITSRMMNTEKLLRVINAYSDRKYDGDLTDILNFRVKTDFLPPNKEMMRRLVTSMPQEAKNIKKFNELIFARKISIDNNKMNGFLDDFVKHERDCRNLLCGKECCYCNKYAKKALVVDREYNNVLLEKLDENFTKLASGDFYDSHPNSISWSDEALKIFNELLSLLSPKDKVNTELPVNLLAESFAKTRKRELVDAEDVIHALYSRASKDVKESIANYIQQNLGINIADLERKWGDL